MIPLVILWYAARKRRLQHLPTGAEEDAILEQTTDIMVNMSERTPLLPTDEVSKHHFWSFHDADPSPSKQKSTQIITADNLDSIEACHAQFCALVGYDPSQGPDNIPPKSLYGRALRNKRSQQWTYAITAALSNTLLLSQVVLGAALTALGASESSHILITLFGAANTIIAGVVAYLKSRGQPMRARMYRDDLERVVDEIENSEIMWRGLSLASDRTALMSTGISRNMHGYSEIPLHDGQVTVRSEVARLTRLYDRTIRTNTLNSPDMYQSDMFGGITSGGGGLGKFLKQHDLGPNNLLVAPVPTVVPAASTTTPSAAVAVVSDPDQSPATIPDIGTAPVVAVDATKESEVESIGATNGKDSEDKGKQPAK
jgi:SMODS and SLOG-associating 2TM effector domain